MNVTASLTSSGTVSYTCACYVGKDSLDTPRKTLLIGIMMMDYEDILMLKKPKPITITENVETPIAFTYLFQNLMVRLWNFFLSFPLFITPLDMFPIAFTWTFEFISPTSILEPAISPTFEQFYPPPILTKHPVWYSLDADFFIALQGTLYGLHQEKI